MSDDDSMAIARDIKEQLRKVALESVTRAVIDGSTAVRITRKGATIEPTKKSEKPND